MEGSTATATEESQAEPTQSSSAKEDPSVSLDRHNEEFNPPEAAHKLVFSV